MLEPGHPDTLRVVQNLGLMHHSRGSLDKAEKMWQRSTSRIRKGARVRASEHTYAFH